jgi:cystathionine beta-lyase/cystathionine gamma-synthase
VLPESFRVDENDARSYLLALGRGLLSEIRTGLREPECADLSERAEKLLRELEAADLRTYGLWQRSVHAYEALGCLVANARNVRARVARSYESMEELHHDADAQLQGRSAHAVWDTHEHGRRRQLEAALAACHHCESTLLVNSGMSAVTIALGTVKPARGATILVGRGGHFETTDYLTRFVAPLGVKVVHVPSGNAGAVLDALRTLAPTAALFETAVNAPGGEAPSGISRWFEASPETLFIVDNTVQSVLTRWFDGKTAPGLESRLIVVESVTKYLAHHCTAGLIYGPEAIVARMRDLARATGQQLQEKAFNFLRPAEIEHLAWKLSRHARNVGVFVEEIGAAKGVDVRTLDSGTDTEARAALFRHGPGGIVFMRLRGHGAGERGHRELLAEWQAEARRQGAWVPVRAGFGWNDTTAIVHEHGRGRPEGGPAYLRISIGIEPECVARRLAQALATACAKHARPAQ